MIKELSKPKRGACFMLDKKYVWLYIIKPDGSYLVCDDHTFHLESYFSEVSPDDLRPTAKARKPIGNKQKPLTAEEKQVKANLNSFFDEALNELPDNCQECGAALGCLSAWDARCCTAHILPKSPESGFPTIACHPVNKLFLGKKNCSCHTRYDEKGAAFRSSMKVYPVVLAAFEILKLELSEHDIIRAKKYLNINT